MAADAGTNFEYVSPFRGSRLAGRYQSLNDTHAIFGITTSASIQKSLQRLKWQMFQRLSSLAPGVLIMKLARLPYIPTPAWTVKDEAGRQLKEKAIGEPIPSAKSLAGGGNSGSKMAAGFKSVMSSVLKSLTPKPSDGSVKDRTPGDNEDDDDSMGWYYGRGSSASSADFLLRTEEGRRLLLG